MNLVQNILFIPPVSNYECYHMSHYAFFNSNNIRGRTPYPQPGQRSSCSLNFSLVHTWRAIFRHIIVQMTDTYCPMGLQIKCGIRKAISPWYRPKVGTTRRYQTKILHLLRHAWGMSKMYDGHLKGVAFFKYSDFIILQLSPLLSIWKIYNKECLDTAVCLVSLPATRNIM